MTAARTAASRRVLLATAATLVAAACGLIDDDPPAATGEAPSASVSTTTAGGADEPDDSVIGPADAARPAVEPNAVVLFVVDGDTVEVDIDGIQESVRLIGIDTPEKTGGFRDPECFGDEASAHMQALVGPGDPVFLELDEEARDRFDRLLAYVYRADDGLFLNLAMVEGGFAAAFPFEPNTAWADVFADAERRARERGLGLWAACEGPDQVLTPTP